MLLIVSNERNTKSTNKGVIPELGTGYRVESGVKVSIGDLKGKVSDYSVITDEGQGHTWYKDGYYKHVNHGTNYEICGTRLQRRIMQRF